MCDLYSVTNPANLYSNKIRIRIYVHTLWAYTVDDVTNRYSIFDTMSSRLFPFFRLEQKRWETKLTDSKINIATHTHTWACPTNTLANVCFFLAWALSSCLILASNRHCWLHKNKLKMKHSSENKPPICRKGTISRDKTEFSAILIFGMRHSRRTHLLQTYPLYSNRCCRPISPFEISLTGSCLFFSLCFLR